jgi:hypothetical protein
MAALFGLSLSLVGLAQWLWLAPLAAGSPSRAMGMALSALLACALGGLWWACVARSETRLSERLLAATLIIGALVFLILANLIQDVRPGAAPTVTAAAVAAAALGFFMWGGPPAFLAELSFPEERGAGRGLFSLAAAGLFGSAAGLLGAAALATACPIRQAWLADAAAALAVGLGIWIRATRVRPKGPQAAPEGSQAAPAAETAISSGGLQQAGGPAEASVPAEASESPEASVPAEAPVPAEAAGPPEASGPAAAYRPAAGDRPAGSVIAAPTGDASVHAGTAASEASAYAGASLGAEALAGSEAVNPSASAIGTPAAWAGPAGDENAAASLRLAVPEAAPQGFRAPFAKALQAASAVHYRSGRLDAPDGSGGDAEALDGRGSPDGLADPDGAVGAGGGPHSPEAPGGLAGPNGSGSPDGSGALPDQSPQEPGENTAPRARPLRSVGDEFFPYDVDSDEEPPLRFWPAKSLGYFTFDSGRGQELLVYGRTAQTLKPAAFLGAAAAGGAAALALAAESPAAGIFPEPWGAAFLIPLAVCLGAAAIGPALARAASPMTALGLDVFLLSLFLAFGPQEGGLPAAWARHLVPLALAGALWPLAARVSLVGEGFFPLSLARLQLWLLAGASAGAAACSLAWRLWPEASVQETLSYVALAGAFLAAAPTISWPFTGFLAIAAGLLYYFS